MKKERTDILIIGTGASGAAAAWNLSKLNLKITCLDENPEMLQICKDRLIDNGYFKDIIFTQNAMEDVKLAKNFFSLATLAFGFRNFTDHKKALNNIYKSISPGGRLVIMEFTTPENNILKSIFEKYTHRVIPKIGKMLADDYDSYKYLAESISSFYKPSEVSEMLRSSGFENVRYEFMPGNMVTLHIGYKC